ncbi:MFS transporter [Streptomyces atroolivaceus]|uniref:MFS transporter n=1 Tax=Streptomyces atroolivaceus TaxID=66869 RepID=A0ABV9V5K8_STRAZ|nr:MFS transporter [Streptomyces atroolivaceus]
MFLALSRAVRASPYRPVMSHTTLRRILPGFAVSSLGDGMAVVAVSWLAIELAPAADRSVWVASAAAAYTLSGAAGALLLGRFLRHRRPALLAGWDAALRAVMLGAIPVLHAFDALGIKGYVVLLALSSVLHSWGQAGIYTLIARVLPARDHLAGNAVLSGVGSVATVAGPPLATLLIVLGGPATVLAVDAATFLVLAVTFLLLVPGEGVPEPQEEQASRAAGFSVIRQTPALSGLLALSFAFFFLFGPVYVALPLHVSEGLGAPAGVLAAFYTAFGAGAVLGSFLTGFLSRWRMWPTTLGIVTLFGLLMLPLGLGAPTTVSVPASGSRDCSGRPTRRCRPRSSSAPPPARCCRRPWPRVPRSGCCRSLWAPRSGGRWWPPSARSGPCACRAEPSRLSGWPPRDASRCGHAAS